VKRGDEELPNLRHRFESAATERVGVGWDTSPAENAQALDVGGGFHRGSGDSSGRNWKKRKPQTKYFGQINSLLVRAGAEKFAGEGGQQTSTVAAGPVGIDAASMRQAFEGGERNVDNLVAGGAAEARHKARAAGIVIGMAPVRVPRDLGRDAPSVHTSLLSLRSEDVQRRICIYQIGFVGEEILSRGLLELCNF
jgi:hypothetical protein